MYEKVLEWWSKLDQKQKKIILDYLEELETKKNKIMSLQVKGKVVKILEVESGTSKAGKAWQKQGFVIDTGAQYNPEVCFQVFGEDKIAQLIAPISEGMEVDVAFNLNSREWEGKYFHNVDAWKVTPTSASTTASDNAPAGSNDSDAEDDDLPF